MTIGPEVSIARVRRALLWCVVIFPLGALGAALVVSDWPARRFLIFYIAPLFATGPAWLYLRLAEGRPRLDLRTILDASVFVLAVARFLTGKLLPFSGHMLFLSYTALVTRSTRYRLIAFALLLETTWFKLALWNDVTTWGLGLGLGVVAAVISAWFGHLGSRETTTATVGQQQH